TAHKLLRTTFPFVSTAFTVPVTTLALAIGGGIVLLRRRRGQPVVEGEDGGTEPEAPVAADGGGKPSWLRPGADVDRAPGALLAGGFAGGASLGMNRQFWAYCVLPMLDWVNRSHDDNRQMYWHDVLGDALNMYRREGRLDLQVGDTGTADAGIQRSRMGLLVH